MVKIFRRLRQQSLFSKQFRNYLFYAIGEIILVVIGILIALAIDASQEDKRLRQKEQAYLAGLRVDFETNQNKLEELIRFNRNSYESAKEILRHCRKLPVDLDEKQFSDLLFSSFAFDLSYNPNNSLLEEMINSGSLKDISNPELKRRLTTWLSTLEDIAQQEKNLADERAQVLDMFRADERSIRTIFDLTGQITTTFGLSPRADYISNLDLLQSPAFENNILTFLSTCYSTEQNHYLPLLEQIENIRTLVE